MTDPTIVRERLDASIAGWTSGRLGVLDAIAVDVETELAHLEASLDVPEDDEPGREALKSRLRSLRDATSELRHSPATR